MRADHNNSFSMGGQPQKLPIPLRNLYLVVPSGSLIISTFFTGLMITADQQTYRQMQTDHGTWSVAVGR